MSGELLSRIRGEIDARLRELRPAVAEYERLLDAAAAGGARRGSGRRPAQRAAKGAGATARRHPAKSGGPPARQRAARSPGEKAVIAALEHGSHTVSELVVVTALSAANVRESLRSLTRTGTVTKAVREGRPAYALSRPAG